jgi:broad specificity phosphatase PhoE
MSNSLTTIYIVRHGQSVANAEKIVGSDTELTVFGRRQAQELSKKLQNIHFSKIFSSDLIRAKQTAEIIGLEHKLAVIAYKELRERDYGKYEGISENIYREQMKSIFERMQNMSYEEIRKYRRYESFETDEEVLTRFITRVRELAIAYKGETLLITSHATLMKVFLTHLGFFKDHRIPTSPISNTGYIKVESDGVDFFLRETSGIQIE